MYTISNDLEFQLLHSQLVSEICYGEGSITLHFEKEFYIQLYGYFSFFDTLKINDFDSIFPVISDHGLLILLSKKVVGHVIDETGLKVLFNNQMYIKIKNNAHYETALICLSGRIIHV